MGVVMMMMRVPGHRRGLRGWAEVKHHRETEDKYAAEEGKPQQSQGAHKPLLLLHPRTHPRQQLARHEEPIPRIAGYK